MHKGVMEIVGKKLANKNGCLKSKTGEILMEKCEIINRWTEYIGDLYNDNRQDFHMSHNEESPSILLEEVANAIKHTNSGKAPGPDNLVIEEIAALGDFGVDILTRMLNDIYNTGYLPHDLKKSIFIPLPKIDRAIECEDHRTIC